MSQLSKNNEQIRKITRSMDGVKLTSTYLISTELYKIETKKLIKLVTEKFLNHPATIMALVGTKENLLMDKRMPLWKIPISNLPLKEQINKEIKEKLDIYFKELESRKSSFLETSEKYNFTKVIFTPLIEGNGSEVTLYFIALTIYSNGSLLIELFEDLKNIEYISDFFTAFSFMEYKLFPDFEGKNRTYKVNSDKQIIDIKKYIISELTNINNNNPFTELSFITHFITNMTEMNKLSFFKKFELHTWLVNAPYSPESFIKGITLEDSSKYLRTETKSNEKIKYISKGTNYVVWNNVSSYTSKKELFLDQASFFLSAANPYFQTTALNETIIYSIEKFHLEDSQKLLEFNEWAHQYRKTFLHIYRAPYIALTDLFNELITDSDFKEYEFINQIKNEEIKLIQEKNTHQENKKNKNIEIIMYTISALSILQVIDIFTDNLCT